MLYTKFDLKRNGVTTCSLPNPNVGESRLLQQQIVEKRTMLDAMYTFVIGASGKYQWAFQFKELSYETFELLKTFLLATVGVDITIDTGIVTITGRHASPELLVTYIKVGEYVDVTLNVIGDKGVPNA